jgi:hypothetical protein
MNTSAGRPDLTAADTNPSPGTKSPISRHIKAVMLISGVLTSTMVYAALFPQAALQSTFGEGLDGPLAELLVRNWGVLVALVGAGLIYGAIRPASRQAALMAAVVSKTAFIGLVLSNGWQYLEHGAGPAVVIDSIMVLLFVWYLAGGGGARRAHPVQV